MQILELLFLINGLKKCKWTSLCTWYVIFALFTLIFYISKTDKILQFFSQFSSKFSKAFLRQQVHMYAKDFFQIQGPPLSSSVFDWKRRKWIYTVTYKSVKWPVDKSQYLDHTLYQLLDELQEKWMKITVIGKARGHAP